MEKQDVDEKETEESKNDIKEKKQFQNIEIHDALFLGVYFFSNDSNTISGFTLTELFFTVLTPPPDI